MQQRLKDCRVLFGDIFIAPFLGSALGLTAMFSLGWENLVAFDWNDLPVGRKFDYKFLKKVKSPPYALPPPPPPPPPPPRRHYSALWQLKSPLILLSLVIQSMPVRKFQFSQPCASRPLSWTTHIMRSAFRK